MKSRFENPYCPPGSIVSSGFLRDLVKSGRCKIDFVEDDGAIVFGADDPSLIDYLDDDNSDQFVHTMQSRCLESEYSCYQETGFFVWISTGAAIATRKVMVSMVCA